MMNTTYTDDGNHESYSADSDTDVDNAHVVERAFDIFLETAEQERSVGNYEKALKNLNKAALRAEKLPPDHPKLRLIRERQKNLSLRVQLSSSNRLEPFSFSVHYVTRCKELTDPVEYRNFSSLFQLVRKKVFCDELNIPENVERDERDDVSLHILAKIGDAPAAYARIWVRQSAESNIGVLDRFCTLPAYRLRGLGAGCLEAASKEVNGLNARGAFTPPINLIVVEIPIRQFAIQNKMQQAGLVKLNEGTNESPVMYYDSESQRYRINTVHLGKQLSNNAEVIRKDVDFARQIATRQTELARQQTQ